MYPHLLLHFCSARFHLGHSWFSKSATFHIGFAPCKHLQAYCLAWPVLYWFDFFFPFLFLLCSVLFYNILWCRQRLYGCWASLLIGFTSLFEGGFTRVFAGSCLFLFPQKWKWGAAQQCYSTIHFFLQLPLCRPPRLFSGWERAGFAWGSLDQNKKAFPVPPGRELEQGSAQCWILNAQVPLMASAGILFMPLW